MESQRLGHRKAQSQDFACMSVFHMQSSSDPSGTVTQAWRPIEGGQGKRGPGLGALCPKAAFSMKSGRRTEGSVLGGGRVGAPPPTQVSTGRGTVPSAGQLATGTDRLCHAPPCFRSLRRMTPSNCPTLSMTSLWGGGKSQMSPWAACPCGLCLCRER